MLYSDVVRTSFAAAKELLQSVPTPPHTGDLLLQLALPPHVPPHKVAVAPIKVSSPPPALQAWLHLGPAAMWVVMARIIWVSALDAVAANGDTDADAGLSTAGANADPALVDEIGGAPEFKVNVGQFEKFDDRAGVVVSGKAVAGVKLGVGGPVSRWGVGGPVRRDLKLENI